MSHGTRLEGVLDIFLAELNTLTCSKHFGLMPLPTKYSFSKLEHIRDAVPARHGCGLDDGRAVCSSVGLESEQGQPKRFR